MRTGHTGAQACLDITVHYGSHRILQLTGPHMDRRYNPTTDVVADGDHDRTVRIDFRFDLDLVS